MGIIRKHRGGAVAVTVALLSTLAACSGGATPSGTPAASGGASSPASTAAIKIAFVTKPLDNVYFGSMVTGGQAAAKDLGVELTVAAAQNVSDDSGQASKLEALVGSQYNCYILNPTSPTNLIQPLASASNPTVINIDLEMDAAKAKAAGVTINTYIGTVNKDAGAQAGKAMLDLVPQGSDVAVVGTLAQDAGNIQRQAGFHSVVDGKLNVVQTVSADADRAKAKSQAAAIMRANPNVKGFFTPAGTQAMGIQEAIKQEGRTDVKVVGIDGTKEELESIKNGELAATVEQFPYLMGYQAVQACVEASKGKTLPARVDTPTLIVTKANAAEALEASPAPPASFTVPNPFN